jgi:hypothetical protein
MPYRDPQRQRNAANRNSLEKSEDKRDIAPGYPGSGDKALLAACERDLERFCKSYFPNAFSLPWSKDHLKAIERLQSITLDGGLFALAMPRAAGKTTLAVRTALWALLYKHRRFVCLIGATEDHAKGLLKHFKTELTFNPLLYRDFRWVSYPLVRLENNGRKCIGQHFSGIQTRIDWSVDRLSFPTMPDSACDGPNVSGSTVTVAGLTGAFRGQSTTLPNGAIIRPELVILDDPQTRESATSRDQSAKRAETINGDALGMAGPGRKIAAIMPCTVIQADDMASRFLDRKQNPEWNGQRTRMVYSFPKAEDLWEEYRAIRETSLIAERGGVEATEFYAAHRAEMDEGAEVAWPERFEPGELSAIQHAMNLKLRNERAFFAEYQNDPLPEEEVRRDLLTADQIAHKLNSYERGVVPISCTHLTAFIDVHADVHYYSVIAWEDNFTGFVVDYGTFPDQKRPYFAKHDAKVTLAGVVKAAGLEGQIYGGLERLTEAILGREWVREDEATMRVERCLIDSGWGQQTDLIFKFCRESAHAAVLTPSQGRGIRASQSPMRDWPKKPGDRTGPGWVMPLTLGKRAIRKVIIDVNLWKSFVHSRLGVAMGDRGCLSLYGKQPEIHRLYADHLVAEQPKAMQQVGGSRIVDEWGWTIGHPDNHYLDTLVGAAVAASMVGCVLPEATATTPAPKSKRVSFADLQQKRRA